MHVAVLGLGIIGATWARNLQQDGLPVRVWNRTRKDFPGWCDTPESAATGSELIIIVVSDPAAVQDVLKRILPGLKAGQIEVRLSVTPLDPAKLSSPGEALTIFGNAYRLKATYQPSGAAASLAVPLDVILLYPVTTNLHAATHQLYTSADGITWAKQEGSDARAQQQAEGPMPSLGDV